MAQKMIQLDFGFDEELQRIAVSLSSAKKVVVIIGAGVSIAANIPVYRRSRLRHTLLTIIRFPLREWTIYEGGYLLL